MIIFRRIPTRCTSYCKALGVLLSLLSFLTIGYRAQSAPAPPQKIAKNEPMVCIDPGHPSETSEGAQVGHITEMHLNWLIALQLRKDLMNAGINVTMTKRGEKQYVTNRKRAEIANSCHALLFLRLHCDSAGGSGYTLYYPAHAITKQGVTGPSAIVQKESLIASIALLKGIHPELKGYMKENRLKTDNDTAVGKRQGGALTGSVFSRTPTVLIEMGDMSHPQDLAFLNSQRGQQRMAQALTTGIITYLHLCYGKKF